MSTVNVMGRHRSKDSSAPAERAEIVDHVLALLDSMCLQLGGLLESAPRSNFDEWASWVEAELPFTVEEARRLRGVFLAYKLFTADIVEDLPKPWQALWTIPAARIGRGMPRHATQAKRVSAPELLATRLLASDPNGVSTDVVSSLERWLRERTQPSSG